ncbi:3-oxoadipate enol-lactonase [Pigmentiphaga sp. NML080357]|uniref:alpha/beta fold hydrolase n=1 Tax=Pigmentiphaga sp. NML080357 TaxID=2008675 RepID=UPI000B40D508|nr:alpha/beta fold hydrolase [Pigmentiphaga sp. NML080357]OVZ57935.1 3-oxoadipate enol-lactonase [Pigmentiphaga sp. NML080357]
MTTRTRVVRSGAGEPIVLVHGVGLDLGMWDELVQELGGDFELIRYDMLGHGGTPLPPGGVDLDRFVSQLDAVLRDQGLVRPSVVGYSMGGLVAGRFAARHPDGLGRLVLMSTVSRRTEAERRAVQARLAQAERGEGLASAQASIERWFSPAFIEAAPGRVESIRQRLLANRRDDFLAAYRIFAGADDVLPEAAPQIRCPTLVLTGAEDTGSTPRMAEELAHAIARAELRVVPRQKHMLPVEGAAVVAAALRGFLGPGAERRVA